MAKAKKKVTKKKTSKKATKAVKKTPAKKEMLLVLSKTKEALKGSANLNVSPETFDALNEHIFWLISQAQARCQANGRKTIRPYDILA